VMDWGICLAVVVYICIEAWCDWKKMYREDRSYDSGAYGGGGGVCLGRKPASVERSKYS